MQTAVRIDANDIALSYRLFRLTTARGLVVTALIAIILAWYAWYADWVSVSEAAAFATGMFIVFCLIDYATAAIRARLDIRQDPDLLSERTATWSAEELAFEGGRGSIRLTGRDLRAVRETKTAIVVFHTTWKTVIYPKDQLTDEQLADLRRSLDALRANAADG
jgi:hypothetical protein